MVKVSAEAFDVFNFPLRNLPTESITSANFGRVTSVLTGYQARAATGRSPARSDIVAA